MISRLMGMLPKVKCSRCDRSFLGLKNKCPHCGANRGRGGKRATDVSDAQVRLIIRGLILLTLVITIISAVAIDFDDDPSMGFATGPGLVQNPEEEGEENGENENIPAPPPTPTPPPPPPAITITGVDFYWRFKVGNINEMSINVGDTIDVRAEVFPMDAEADIVWSTDNPTACNFRVDPDDHAQVELLARGPGVAHITVTASNAAGEADNVLIVRVR